MRPAYTTWRVRQGHERGQGFYWNCDRSTWTSHVLATVIYTRESAHRIAGAVDGRPVKIRTYDGAALRAALKHCVRFLNSKGFDVEADELTRDVAAYLK